MRNLRRRRQRALRRFLATLLANRCDRAPDINRAHPQGVHRDSVGNLKLLTDLKAGETPALRTFFEHAALYYMQHRALVYIIYDIFFDMYLCTLRPCSAPPTDFQSAYKF